MAHMLDGAAKVYKAQTLKTLKVRALNPLGLYDYER